MKPLVKTWLTQGFSVQTLYASKNILIKKSVLLSVQPARFQRVQVLKADPGSQWRVGLPNDVSLAFIAEVDSVSLATILNLAVGWL
ncbi:MAG: hypothetical protein L3J22_06070 [Xanthomonadales bacterium]|nr:hypothetical protein [Xanthomonadales bacterium]